jgi:hypothetical protein
MILSNQVRCVQCGDEPYSAHRHDFQHCECGAVAVDGGMDYLRRVGNPDDYIDISISITEEDYEAIVDAITDSTKNELGKVCRLARVLRDDMNINIGV